MTHEEIIAANNELYRLLKRKWLYPSITSPEQEQRIRELMQISERYEHIGVSDYQ